MSSTATNPGLLGASHQPTIIGGDDPKTRSGYIVVILGICAVVISLFLALAFVKSTSTIAEVLGPATATIGTLVGAYFGISHAGARQDQTTDAALKLAAVADPDRARAVLGLTPAHSAAPELDPGDSQTTREWQIPKSPGAT